MRTRIRRVREREGEKKGFSPAKQDENKMELESSLLLKKILKNFVSFRTKEDSYLQRSQPISNQIMVDNRYDVELVVVEEIELID